MNVDREALEVAAAVCRECHPEPIVHELAEVFGGLRALARLTARGQMDSSAPGTLESARDTVSEILRAVGAGRMDGEAATARLADLEQRLMGAARRARELTPIEAAALRILAKPSPIQVDDIRADFCVRAFSDPSDLVQAVFSSVDWDAINEHMEQPK